LDNAFQLGVTRTPTRNNSEVKNCENDASQTDGSTTEVIMTSSESLWPAKDAVSWSGTTSAFTDMLF
jgi:hypothetical protein